MPKDQSIWHGAPVPRDEIQRFTLRQEKLSVDGNFALMRSDSVAFGAERSGGLHTGLSP